MTIYWSHITGVKVLVIAERGLLLVIMIAADVGARDTEREMKNPSHFKVCSSNFRPRPSHHNPASTENTAFLLSIHAAFLCSWCRQRLSTEQIFSLPWMQSHTHQSMFCKCKLQLNRMIHSPCVLLLSPFSDFHTCTSLCKCVILPSE